MCNRTTPSCSWRRQKWAMTVLSNQTDVFRPTCTFTCDALQLPTSTPLPAPSRGQHGLCLTSVSSSSLWNMSLFLLVSPSMWLSNSFSFSSLSSCSVRSQRWSLRSCLRVSRHPSSVVRTCWGRQRVNLYLTLCCHHHNGSAFTRAAVWGTSAFHQLALSHFLGVWSLPEPLQTATHEIILVVSW